MSIDEDLSAKVMGVINVSPESFYKGSIKTTEGEIAKTAKEMQENGAHLIDVGAMSTAPYLETLIPAEEEIRRITRAITAIKRSCSLPIVADTPRAIVAKSAIEAGADAINDVTGLKYDSEMSKVTGESGVAVIIGAYSPRTVTGLISGTMKALKESLSIAKKAGVLDNKIIVDPSIGFFRNKSGSAFFTKMTDLTWYSRDIEVLSKLKELKKIAKTVCVSVSRKSFIGELFELKTEDRLAPSIACELVAVLNGANLVRTHDVKETVQALTMLQLLD